MSVYKQFENKFRQARLEKAFKLQGQMNFQGLDIKIENRVGSVRHWKTEDGKEGKTKMHTRYGYVARTKGTDGDAVDVYVSDINPQSDKVFVIHQKFPDTGEYDEDKCMLGFNTEEQAINEYLLHYDSPEFFDSCEQFTMEEFKEALKDLIGHKITKTSIEKALDLIEASRHSYLLDSNGNPILSKADNLDAALVYSGLKQYTPSRLFITAGELTNKELAKAVMNKDPFIVAQLKFRKKRIE